MKRDKEDLDADIAQSRAKVHSLDAESKERLRKFEEEADLWRKADTLLLKKEEELEQKMAEIIKLREGSADSNELANERRLKNQYKELVDFLKEEEKFRTDLFRRVFKKVLAAVGPMYKGGTNAAGLPHGDGVEIKKWVEGHALYLGTQENGKRKGQGIFICESGQV